MSDKKVLKESTIRKMMKLANIPALSDKFIQENYYSYNEQEEVEAEEEELALDAPVEEPAMDDVEMDAEVDLEEPAGDELPAPEKLVTDLMGVIEDHFPEVVIDVAAEAPADEEEIEVDAEVEVEDPMLPEPMDDMGGEEELEVDAEVEEEPVLEADLEEGDAAFVDEPEDAGLAYANLNSPGEKAMMGEEEYEGDVEVDAVEVVEEDPRSDLIDAIAAKVAERLLAEAKKTNK